MNATEQNIATAPVMQYMRHFMETAPPIPESVMAGVTFVDGFALIVLDRQGPFQAQLTLCAPGAESGDHSHPNVDSIVYYVTGEVYFRIEHEGQMVQVYKPGEVHEIGDELERCSHHGKWLRVLPGQMHGATIGPKGGAFISFQHWVEGKPTSVDQDWHGPTLNVEHAKRIQIDKFIVDDFVPDFHVLRSAAMENEFKPTEHNGSVYRGVGTKNVPNLNEAIGKVMGRKVDTKVSFFRLGIPGNEPNTHIHVDQCAGRSAPKWAAVLYLNEAEDCLGGTAFWRHKETGLIALPPGTPKEIERKLFEEGNDPSKWEQVGFVEMKPNRLVIYPTNIYHSRFPRDGYGDGVKNGRLIWVGFFDTCSAN